jgi:uncharacterized membrane protein YgdD (TMEM256/DUF423 family)
VSSTSVLRIAGIAGFLAVALGAFGAHALKPTLEANGNLSIWQTAASYHLAHSVVLLVLATRATLARWAFGLFGIGIIIFSGSLYLLAVTNIKWIGAITPFGGLCLLAGWLVLAFGRTSAGS